MYIDLVIVGLLAYTTKTLSSSAASHNRLFSSWWLLAEQLRSKLQQKTGVLASETHFHRSALLKAF